MRNNHGWIVILSQGAVAIATIALAYSSWQHAQQAEKIAQQANELVYKSNLPCIAATRQTEYKEGKATEKITISNVGHAFGPPYDALLYAYIEIDHGSGSERTYLQLYDYYGDSWSQFTGNNTGIILVGFSDNNLANYSQIEDGFKKAGSKYVPTINFSLIPILSVRYADFMGKLQNEYYKFVGQRLEHIEYNEYEKIATSANKNNEQVRLMDISLNIKTLDWAKLWEWYKNHKMMLQIK